MHSLLKNTTAQTLVRHSEEFVFRIPKKPAAITAFFFFGPDLKVLPRPMRDTVLISCLRETMVSRLSPSYLPCPYLVALSHAFAHFSWVRFFTFIQDILYIGQIECGL